MADLVAMLRIEHYIVNNIRIYDQRYGAFCMTYDIHTKLSNTKKCTP